MKELIPDRRTDRLSLLNLGPRQKTESITNSALPKCLKAENFIAPLF